MIRNISNRQRRSLMLAVMTAIMSSLGVATPAGADTLHQYLQNVAAIHVGTAEGVYSVLTEYALINIASAQYLLQQAQNNVPVIGQAELDGAYPATIFANPGDTKPLSFEWIDTTTGLPTAGPTVIAVDYYISPDPYNPFNYSYLGTSTDSGSNFSLPYTIGSTESEFRASPIGPGGPIFIEGLGGYNVAEGYVASLIPEPSSWALLGIGAVLLGFFRRKRKR